MPKNNKPEILAPAGGRSSFLSAIAAGADCIYCGLKLYSARMTADNFTLPELSSLADMARMRNIKVYLTFNTLLKDSNLNGAAKLISQIAEYISPEALIIQDIATGLIARESGYSGEIHFSTLANISSLSDLIFMKQRLSTDRVVLPRELTLDEIRALSSSSAIPDLEVFVHGALCYGISGRCYWSSLLGGKSGLRGRCVQPCRRIYDQNDRSGRYFSCMDFGLEESVKSLLSIDRIKGWKIEGRKKGAHYVYNAVTAYKILRDNIGDKLAVKEAKSLISASYGRKTTKYFFHDKDSKSPVFDSGESASGLMIGKINNEKKSTYFTTREGLFSDDILRIGYEDEPGHQIYKVKDTHEKNSRVDISVNNITPKSGSPVFIIDRRDDRLNSMISELEKEFSAKSQVDAAIKDIDLRYDKINSQKINVTDILLSRSSETGANALWLSYDTLKGLDKSSIKKIWWWLPPVVWPSEEKNLQGDLRYALDMGAKNFILNSPWQAGRFDSPEEMNLWAGPFCNISNSAVVSVLKDIGFSGVIVSPELGELDYMSLPRESALPLGIVVSANWPVCVSRALPGGLNLHSPFRSSMKEEFWAERINSNMWVFPNWRLDLTQKLESLHDAGYSLFVYMNETVPASVTMKKRPGVWNWDHGLM